MFIIICNHKNQIENLSTTNVTEQNSLIKANEFAIFTTAKPKLQDNLIAELGLRINYYISGWKSYFHFQPRVVLIIIGTEIFVYASYNRQNQYLNLMTSSVGIPTDFWVASSDGIPAILNEFQWVPIKIISKRFSSSLAHFIVL
jgi:hypothetical protein